MKRRERERVVQEVATQMVSVRAALLHEEEEKVQKELRDSAAHREILAENQLKIEVLLSFVGSLVGSSRAVLGTTAEGISRATKRRVATAAKYPKAAKRRCEQVTIILKYWGD